MEVKDFDYYLPEELIAQFPVEKRDESRLMVIHRETNAVEHKKFYELPNYLDSGDCLVLNNSKVLPARIFGKKKGTGANIEFLLTKNIIDDEWQVLAKPGKRLKNGDCVVFYDDRGNLELEAVVLGDDADGTKKVKFRYDGMFLEVLERIGNMPLPPYINRKSLKEDKKRYQTVYCEPEGSVAAPTAGLHFTDALLEKIKNKGVNIAYVTLHVGIGTFRPVKCDNIEEHHMHFEQYCIDEKNAEIINETKASGGRIIPVGTTSTRTLESAAVCKNGEYQIEACEGNTDIFIYPGYEFKIIDSLITNFHLPKSTLLMLISALYDREEILKIYNIAVTEKYRFFSYGDAMFIR